MDKEMTELEPFAFHIVRNCASPEEHGYLSFGIPPDAHEYELNIDRLYTEAQLLAMYAKGAEDMREQAAVLCDDDESGRDGNGYFADIIRAIPITPTNTEGEQDADV